MTWTFYNAQGQEKRGAGLPASIPLDPWHVIGAVGEPSFQGLWKHYSASFQQVGFRKDAFGRVHLKGLLGCTGVSGNGTPIFVLPAGYRPPLTAVLDTSVPGTANNVRIDVQTDGVVLFNTAVSAMSATVFIDLDHLSFDTETVTTFPVGPQGVKGDNGDPGLNDYALTVSTGASTACGQGAWTRLPLGALSTSTPNEPGTCFRYNADGTITVLRDGWYTMTTVIGNVNPLTVDAGVQYGVWADATDTTPANPAANQRTEFSAASVGNPVLAFSGMLWFGAGYRIGPSLFNRDVSRSFTANFYIARIGAGPQGANVKWLYGSGVPDNAGGNDGDFYLQDNANVWAKQSGAWVYTGINIKGPAFTTDQEGISDFSATAGTYSIPNGSWGTPGWYAPITVGPNQTWEIIGTAGIQVVSAVHQVSSRTGVRDNTGAALGAAYVLNRNPVMAFHPTAVGIIDTLTTLARLSTDGTVAPGTVIRLVQEFLGGGANGRVIRDGTYYQTWAWRRV